MTLHHDKDDMECITEAFSEFIESMSSPEKFIGDLTHMAKTEELSRQLVEELAYDVEWIDDLSEDTRKTLTKICDHLGVKIVL